VGKGAVGRILLVGAVAAVAGGGGAWAGVSSTASSSAAPDGTAAPATSLTPVVRADLASQQTIPGTVGYDGSWTVVLPAGTAATALAQDQQRITSDQLALASADQALADTTAADQQVIAQDTQAVNAAQNPASLIQATAALTAAQQHATQAEHQAQGQVAAAAGTLRGDQAALTAAQQTALNPGATLTAVPAAGQVVQQGQALYSLDGRAVPLLYGPVAAWRALAPGMNDGPDVAELNQALVALGFEPATWAPHFSNATAAGIRKLQASLGLDQTGTLRLGEVVFEPGPLRISNVSLHPGSPAQPGTAVLTGTSTTPVITALVPLANIAAVKVGDRVSVDLPDGHSGVLGTVRAVGAAAPSVIQASGSQSGGGQGGGQSGGGGGQSGGAGNGATSEPATVTLSNPSSADGMDQAAVLVHITTQTVKGVLAVPVEALLALSGGDEGVEVVSGGVDRVVTVRTGVFTGTQVQISGPAITEGTEVEVPAS
jgi:hypothetical protein